MPEGTPHATGNWLIRSRPMSLKQMLSAKLVAHVSLYSMKMYSEQDLLLSVPFFLDKGQFLNFQQCVSCLIMVPLL